MKKTLALVLALAMVFSSFTVVFAEDALGEDAQICADLGMLKGETGTVDVAYTQTAPSRIQAAVMFLRLKGLEDEAKAFTGDTNFADADNAAWAKPIMAYLKANPQLGWAGDGTNFNPTDKVTAQMYYKVLLEALGYKQSTGEVLGDFEWANVLEFAAGKGLVKVAAVAEFTVNDLAVATVEALKLTVKDGSKTLAATLVEAGKIDEAKAVAAGLVEEEAPAVEVAVDEVMAVGSTAVEVTFKDDVDPKAAVNMGNYAIEGLAINAASLAASDRVRLDTAVMTSGKIYTLTVGGESYKYTGIGKVTGSPEIEKAASQDIEEVEITFTKNIDLATGSDVANYSIAGVEIEKAEVDGKVVTLTTVGLKNSTKYTVKVTGIKSVDGATKRSDSETFTSRFDTVAPKIDTVVAETNQRVVVTFNEKVTEASATDLANYEAAVDKKDGDDLEILDIKYITSGDFKHKRVELTTGVMENKESYKLTVNGLVDRRKAANTMTRASKATFKGLPEDEDAPKFASAKAISPTSILVTFTDKSKIDEASATDLNNYELEDLDIYDIAVVENEYQIFRAVLTVEGMKTGTSYDLEVDGIADEFGNTLENKKLSVRPNANNIKAVAPTNQIATAKRTIIVVFDGELDEASAENISNYKINEGIGSPTKAVYEHKDVIGNSDKEYVVTLTVNDLINGFGDYELTIDGVLDLAGNKLVYEDLAVVTDTYVWDKDAPELEDAEALNNKIVALTFDEKVKFETDAKLLLILNGDVSKDPIQLTAKDTDEDDTVVEFIYAGKLEESVEFSVYKIAYTDGSTDGGIKDLIGNALLFTTIKSEDFAFNGVDDAPDGLEYDSYEQIDGKTFEVKFPRKVVILGGEGDKGDFILNYKSATDHKKVRFKIDGDVLIKDGTDYKFDLGALLTDLHGIPVANDEDDITVTPEIHETVLTGEYDDKDAPYVDDVVAVNRTTIKVIFNERIDQSSVDIADFELRNYDLDEKVTITGLTINATDDKDYIKLTVTKALESRYEYQLTLSKGKLKDVAGILNDSEDVLYFEGSNLQ